MSLSDVVVEAASQKAVPAIARAALAKGKKLMIMSVGALADREFFAEVKSSGQRARLSGLSSLRSDIGPGRPQVRQHRNHSKSDSHHHQEPQRAEGRALHSGEEDRSGCSDGADNDL